MEKKQNQSSNGSQEDQFEKEAMTVSSVSIGVNVLLSLFKLLAGVIAHSGAMISDAIHSASDVFSTIVVMVGIHFAGRKSDKEHPYGHERMECVAAIVLATVLAVTGIGIGWSAIQSIAKESTGVVVVPGVLALVAAVVSTLITPGCFSAHSRMACSVFSSHALSTILLIASLKISRAAFSIKTHITRLASGSINGYPILEAAIPTNAPTEESASER